MNKSQRESELAELGNQIIRAIFTSDIESGRLQVSGRDEGEIISEFEKSLSSLIADSRAFREEGIEPDFSIVIDHRPSLHSAAKMHASMGDYQISLILYATWVEHSINALLMKSFIRDDMSEILARHLIRSASMDTKMGTLWTLANIPKQGVRFRKSVKSLSDLRNAFVHYKWDPEPEDGPPLGDSYAQMSVECESIVETFQQIEDHIYWDGRREQLLEAFDAHESSGRRPADQDL